MILGSQISCLFATERASTQIFCYPTFMPHLVEDSKHYIAIFTTIFGFLAPKQTKSWELFILRRLVKIRGSQWVWFR